MPSKEDKAETAQIEVKKQSKYIVIPTGPYQSDPCGNPAPGGSLRRCKLATNHDSIHRDGAAAWFGDHWA